MTNMGKNNKSNKNQDLERGEAKEGPKRPQFFSKNAKLTRIFLGN